MSIYDPRTPFTNDSWLPFVPLWTHGSWRPFEIRGPLTTGAGGDRRVRKTRRLLHEALVTLILERGWDAVSVRDVCERADVGRSTFYVPPRSVRSGARGAQSPTRGGAAEHEPGRIDLETHEQGRGNERQHQGGRVDQRGSAELNRHDGHQR